MTSERPQVSESGRYPIGEAAKKLGMCRDTLRAKIERGDIKCSFRRDTLRKVITGKELLRFWEATM